MLLPANITSVLSITNFKRLVVCLIAISAQPAVLAVDDLEAGKKLYSQGKFDDAARCFAAKIATAPEDAAAHYLMANVLMVKQRASSAFAEYQTAAKLDTTGDAGRFSRQALASFAASQASPQAVRGNTRAAGLSTAGDGSEETDALGSDSKSDSKPDSKSDASQTRSSAATISKQTDERAKRTNEECDAKVKALIAEGDNRVKKLELEMKERIDSNGPAAWSGREGCGRAMKYYDPEPENNVVREEISPKIESVKKEYKRKVDEIVALYKIKSAALEDSAITLDKSYLQQSKSIKLSPVRTDIYVRTYETSDQLSGNIVPVQASPAKSLRTISKKN